MVAFNNDQQACDEFQTGYIQGWLEAERSRPDRKKTAIVAALAVGMAIGHFLQVFL